MKENGIENKENEKKILFIFRRKRKKQKLKF